MINLLLGTLGAGKSYEAVVFHILPALKQGRKVITNIPLVLERFAAIEPGYLELIELRTKALPVRGRWQPGLEANAFQVTKAEPQEQLTARVFAGVWCYYTEWKHPETGVGPLYVIDECQFSMPRGDTSREVEEWFSLSRQFRADVLLITQSYGKLSKPICDLVQVLYRCRKNIAFGSSGSYTRKVQDGLRGEVVNTAIRRYDKRFFGMWRSHSQTTAGVELNASDLVPIWKHWSVIGAAILIPCSVLALNSDHIRNPLKPEVKPQATTRRTTTTASPAPSASQPASQALSAQAAPEPSADEREPFAAKGLHLTGHAVLGARHLYTFALSQNGQHLATITSDDLHAAGYAWEPLGPCAGRAVYGRTVRTVVCDAPQIALLGPGQKGGARDAGGPSDPAPSQHP